MPLRDTLTSGVCCIAWRSLEASPAIKVAETPFKGGDQRHQALVSFNPLRDLGEEFQDFARFCRLLLVCYSSWGRLSNIHFRMGRGVSSGGGQSSLGYLFGSNDSAKPTAAHAQPVQNPGPTVTGPPPKSTTVPSKPQENVSQVPAGVAGMHETTANNYFRADGQNCGNFITDRPSTKVHSAPGGGSSLGYLFGGNN